MMEACMPAFFPSRAKVACITRILLAFSFSRDCGCKRPGKVDKVALVPYADLLNHSPYVSSGFFFNQIPLSGGKRQVAALALAVIIQYEDADAAALTFWLYELECLGHVVAYLQVFSYVHCTGPAYVVLVYGMPA